MATPKETLWDLEPHTAAKHEILRRYLGAWFPILGKYHGRIVYIDGFSGPGRYTNGEPGSPIIALDVAANHRKSTTGEIVFWFIDERDDRIAHLKQELDGLNDHVPDHFEVTVDSGHFHEKFGDMLASIEVDNTTLAPTFAFIDPFGFSGIPFSLVEKLLGYMRTEVFITFMVDAINRFLEHPDEDVVRHMVETFGGGEAAAIAKGTGDRVENLRRLYQSKLSTVANYVRYFEMRDQNDRTQYYLFFATNHALGHRKMKEAMWKVDPEGDFRFSDATNPDQLVLFEANPSEVLGDQIRNEFQGRGDVTGLQVRKFVEDRTPFLKKHMTSALRDEERSGRLSVYDLKTDGTRRRAGTFPDPVRMTWG